MTGAKFRTMAELDELAASMFQPFADGLKILKQCIDTALFFGDDGGEMHDELVESIGQAMAETRRRRTAALVLETTDTKAFRRIRRLPPGSERVTSRDTSQG